MVKRILEGGRTATASPADLPSSSRLQYVGAFSFGAFGLVAEGEEEADGGGKSPLFLF